MPSILPLMVTASIWQLEVRAFPHNVKLSLHLDLKEYFECTALGLV